MMTRFTMNHDELYPSKHELTRQESHGERKFEEQKLVRLKKLLEAKVQAQSVSGKAIQVA
jgi:hypothetical protein